MEGFSISRNTGNKKLFVIALILALSLNINFAFAQEKKVVEYVPEHLTDKNMLNNLEMYIIENYYNESISVIIELKNQPLQKVSGEVNHEHKAEIESIEEKIDQIYEKTEKLDEEEVLSMGIEAAAQKELSSLTSGEEEQLEDLIEKVDSEKDEIKKKIIEKQTELIEDSQNSVINTINSCNGTVTGNSSLINNVFARIPYSCLYNLKENPEVLAVYEDKFVSINLDISMPTIGAPTWHAAGFDGGIWDVAVIDTGIDTSHPALSSHTHLGKVFHDSAQLSSDYDDNPNSTDDLNGHGTHVAGIIASKDSTYKGTSFGLNTLINAKNCYLTTSGGGLCFQSDGMKAIDWAIFTGGADVISRSIGMCGIGDSDCSMARYLDAVVDGLGIPVANAAGNSGPSSSTVGGVAYNVFSVANDNDKGTVSTSDDSIATLSSRGPTADGRVKPDIAAPGTNIKSAAHNWEGGFLGLNPDFVDLSGTSMAAPHVAGSVLLVLDYKNLKWDPRTIKALFLNTANSSGTFSDKNAFGWGMIDLDHAYAHKDNVFLENVTEGSHKFHKGTNLVSGDKVTLVWNRHVVYGGSNFPSKYFQLNDLDLYIYDESSGNLIASSTSGADNAEQVKTGTSYSSVIIKVDAFTNNFTHNSDLETFALATEENFLGINGPQLSISQFSPSNATVDEKFNITVLVENSGDANAHNINVSLNLPTGLSIASGNNPQNLGTIINGTAKTTVWTIKANTIGTLSGINSNVTSLSYGETFAVKSSNNSVVVTDVKSPTWSSNSTSPSSPVLYTPNQKYQYNISWSDTVGISVVILELNSTNYTVKSSASITSESGGAGGGGTAYSFVIKDLSAGNYSFRWIANDTSNNLNSTQTQIYEIKKSIPSVFLELNSSYTRGQIANITAFTNDSKLVTNIYSNFSGKLELIKFGQGVQTNLTDTANLPVGSYEVVTNVTKNENYTDSQTVSKTLFIVPDTSSPILTSSTNVTPNTYDSNFISNFTAIWSDNIGISRRIIEENFTGTIRNTSMNNSFLLTLPAGTFQFRFLANDTSNNFNSTNTSFLTINPQITTIHLELNGTENNFTFEFPVIVNATGWKNVEEGFLVLLRNGSKVTNPNLFVPDKLGTFNYTLLLNGTNNFTASPIYRIATVQDLSKPFISNNTKVSSTSTKNNQTTVDAGEAANVSLEIRTNKEILNSTIVVANHSQNPSSQNVGVKELNKFVEILTSSELSDSLSWSIIKIFYTDSEVSVAGVEESTLRVWRFNSSTNSWEKFDPPNGNVDTINNFVWANTTHFSVYGLFGSEPQTTTTTTTTTTTSGGGGGGGGTSTPVTSTPTPKATVTPASVPKSIPAPTSTPAPTPATTPTAPTPTSAPSQTGLGNLISGLFVAGAPESTALIVVIVIGAVLAGAWVMYRKRVLVFNNRRH